MCQIWSTSLGRGPHPPPSCTLCAALLRYKHTFSQHGIFAFCFLPFPLLHCFSSDLLCLPISSLIHLIYPNTFRSFLLPSALETLPVLSPPVTASCLPCLCPVFASSPRFVRHPQGTRGFHQSRVRYCSTLSTIYLLPPRDEPRVSQGFMPAGIRGNLEKPPMEVVDTTSSSYSE